MSIIKQFGIIFLICLLGEGVAMLLPFAFPASVIAMLILFVLLFMGILKKEQIETVAGFFLANMAFFFIPSSIGIMNNYADLKPILLPYVGVCVLATVFTFLATAYTVKLCMRFGKKGGSDHGTTV